VFCLLYPIKIKGFPFWVYTINYHGSLLKIPTMKHLALYAMLLLFLQTTLTASAQNTAGSKPKLFNSYPQKIICAKTELSKVFASAAGQSISLSFSDNFLFTGVVTSNTVKYSNLQTAVVRSPVFSDAIFVLSKITDDKGNSNYVGRIINQKYFDGFELKKNASDNYELVKIETDSVIQDCSHN
jgi:hypothetical protein